MICTKKGDTTALCIGCVSVQEMSCLYGDLGNQDVGSESDEVVE